MTQYSTNVYAPYRPPRRVKAHIGEIILAGASIDHLLTLCLFKLARVDFRDGYKLLGRSTIGSTLAKVRQFVNVHEDKGLWAKFQELDALLGPFIEVRNTVAHGTIMGRKGDDIIFSVPSNYSDDLGNFCSAAVGTDEESLAAAAVNGRTFEVMIQELFDVRPLHETVPHKALADAPTSLRSQRKSSPSEFQRQPRSSQA